MKNKKLKRIPDFKNEDQERAFWAKNDSSEYIDWEKADFIMLPKLKPIALKLSILKGAFTIHRFPPNYEIPAQVYESEFYSISKTTDELSITCDASIPIMSEKNEPGWSCIKVEGPLDFSLTGILAKISAVLAEAEISIFAISTFDTDYILVPAVKLAFAKAALQKAGYTFNN